MTSPVTEGFTQPDSDPAPERTSPHRLNFIEGMRALCALYVVLGHIGNIVDPARARLKPSQAPIWMQQLLRPFQEGHLAVATFIVISGFCLAHAAFEKNDPRIANVVSFFKRRATRILPAYYACLLISTYVALKITPLSHDMPFAQYIPVTKDNFLAHVFMVHNFRPEWMYKINGVLWSIAIEFQLYFFFPGIMRVLKKRGWFIPLVAGVAFAVLVVTYIPHGIKFYAWYLPLFIFGAIGAVAAHKKYLRPEFQVFGLMCLVVALYGAGQRWPLWQTDSLFAVPMLALLISGTYAGTRKKARNPLVVRALSWRPLVLVGSFSYSIYLMHHPVLQSLFLLRPKAIHSMTAELIYLTFFGLPLILLFAFGFGLICERRWVLAALKRL